MAAARAPEAEGVWPTWTVPVGIVGGATLGQIAAVVALLPLAAAGAGDGDITGIGLLLSSLGFAVAMVATIALLVRRTEPLSAGTLGLRRVAPAPALVWALLGGALVGAFAFFWAQVADLSDIAQIPPELDGRSSVAERLGIGQPPDQAAFGPGAVASALGRVVVPAILAEVVLRGFALPTLTRWRGEAVGLAITSVLMLAPLGFALGGPSDAGALLPIGLLLGLVLGLLAQVTRSLLPGIALSAAVMGAGFAIACAWSAAGVAAVSACCCLTALTAAAAVAVGRPGLDG